MPLGTTVIGRWNFPQAADLSMFKSICIVVSAAVLTACSGPAAPPPPAVDVTVLTLTPQPATVTLEYVARTEAYNTVEIRPRTLSVAGVRFIV